MKKVMFIVLWTICFSVLTVTACDIMTGWLVSSGIATAMSQDSVDHYRLAIYSSRIVVPLLGLVLGLLGKLPGTRKTESQTHA